MPLSSYFVYRKTGISAWDYSQASRSYLFDIHSKEWIKEIVEYFSIPLPEKILPMGSYVGSSDGICYGLGGHDHIVGFFGIEKILAKTGQELYYSSMGTSEVLATIVPESRLGITKPSRKGYVSPSFFPASYITTRSFRSFGSMLSLIREITGYKDDYSLIESDVSKLSFENASCLFSAEGDFISKNEVGLNIRELSPSSTRASIVQAAYLYLAVVSEIMRRDLASQYKLCASFTFVAGGGITENHLFLEYLATALASPVTILRTQEISALGAAFVGLEAFSPKLADEISKKFGFDTIEPNDRLKAIIRNTLARYEEYTR